MIKYNRKLKEQARQLRTQMTDSERALLERLRRKQVQSVQFYRQKPIGNYIVGLYAPKAKIVVEVDGSQHMESERAARDLQRDAFLASQGLRVLRFDDFQVLKEIEGVMEVIGMPGLGEGRLLSRQERFTGTGQLSSRAFRTVCEPSRLGQ